jgi:hypothetical protein
MGGMEKEGEEMENNGTYLTQQGKLLLSGPTATLTPSLPQATPL